MSSGVGDIIMKIKKPLNSSELRAKLKAILSDMVRAYEGRPHPVANLRYKNKTPLNCEVFILCLKLAPAIFSSLFASNTSSCDKS